MASVRRCTARYIVDRKIGKGSFALVYLVQDEKEEDVSKRVKVLKQIFVGQDPESSAGKTVKVMGEANLLSQLQHKNIVQFYEGFLHAEFFCIVTEYCDGGDLEVTLTRFKDEKRNVPEHVVLKWLKQLLEALIYIHDRRILHRDLKTKNIFIKGNDVKVGDFGISRYLGTSEQANSCIGTLYYMAPEVVNGEPYNEKCDIWSLGCVLYEMCCLKRAFHNQRYLKLSSGATDSSLKLPNQYCSNLNQILGKMLAKNAAERSPAKDLLHDCSFLCCSPGSSRAEPRERGRFQKSDNMDRSWALRTAPASYKDHISKVQKQYFTFEILSSTAPCDQKSAGKAAEKIYRPGYIPEEEDDADIFYLHDANFESASEEDSDSDETVKYSMFNSTMQRPKKNVTEGQGSGSGKPFTMNPKKQQGTKDAKSQSQHRKFDENDQPDVTPSYVHDESMVSCSQIDSEVMENDIDLIPVFGASASNERQSVKGLYRRHRAWAWSDS